MIPRPPQGTLQDPTLVILGGGYTARVIYRLARDRGWRVLISSRRPDRHLSDFPSAVRLEFDLARRETWRLLPSKAEVIWCFPAVPLGDVRDFASRVLSNRPPLIVFGSTSAYDLPRPVTSDGAPLVDECSPIHRGRPRVEGEEYLRQHYAAIVLRLAGIYGPGRNVLNWIRQGRVTASDRYVNLIHVEDIGGVCLAALERGKPGQVYNVSDGVPRRWVEICHAAQAHWRIEPTAATQERGPGKRVSIDKLTTEIGYTFRHPDLILALHEIETAERSTGRQGSTATST